MSCFQKTNCYVLCTNLSILVKIFTFVCSHQDALDDYDIICFHGDQQSTIGVKKKVEENLYTIVVSTMLAECVVDCGLTVHIVTIWFRTGTRLLL